MFSKEDINKMNEETMRRAREAEEDVKRVSAAQDGSYANKELKAVFYGGRYNGQAFSHSELEKLEIIGYTLRFSQLKVHNDALLNLDLEDQPIIKGYLTPMLDGGMLRYK